MRVRRKTRGEQHLKKPAGLPYAVFHGMPWSRKKRWSVRHFCEIGARQMRHGLQHETQQLAWAASNSVPTLLALISVA